MSGAGGAQRVQQRLRTFQAEQELLLAIAQRQPQNALALGEQAERIAAVQPQVTEVQALRARIAAQSAGMDAIADARLKSGDALGVLAAVTQLLPDDTYLVDLALRERRLTITGQSASAPKLIGGLAADPTFRNPGFAAPVTRNAAADRDVFSIRTEVGP